MVQNRYTYRLDFFVLLTLLVFLPVLSRCSSSAPGPALLAGEATQPGPYPVLSLTLNLVDTGRETPANGEYPGATTRSLVTEVWYPESEGGERFPLVIFSHGFAEWRTISDYLTHHLAGFGYVVASPDFPLSNMYSPGGAALADVVNQPGDVKFLIDTLLGYAQTPGNPLEGMINADAVGAFGHSLGGLTTLLAGLHPGYRDHRIKAIMPLSPFACFIDDEDYFPATGLPVLLVGGDADKIVEWNGNMPHAFTLVDAPWKYLIKVFGGTHAGFCTDDIPGNPSLFTMSSDYEVDPAKMMSDLTLAAEGLGGSLDGCMDTFTIQNADWEVLSQSRQREISLILTVAFFELHLRGDSRWEAIFSEEFDDLNLDFEVIREN